MPVLSTGAGVYFTVAPLATRTRWTLEANAASPDLGWLAVYANAPATSPSSSSTTKARTGQRVHAVAIKTFTPSIPGE